MSAYDRLRTDLDMGYSDAAISRRTGYSVGYVRAVRTNWNARWWARRRSQRMTPRSSAGADIERGVGSPVERGT